MNDTQPDGMMPGEMNGAEIDFGFDDRGCGLWINPTNGKSLAHVSTTSAANVTAEAVQTFHKGLSV